MNSEKVYFDIDLNFLLMFCLQKEYEQQVDVVDKEIRKKQWYPAWERFTEMKKEDYNFISDCKEFMLSIHPFKENEDKEIMLTVENLEAFAHWWWKHKMFTDEIYLKKIVFLEKNRKSKLRYLEFINWDRSEIWNKETDAFIEANFGEHWKAILRECVNKFGQNFMEDENNWEKIDSWIEKNIVMKGNWLPDHRYTLKSQGHLNTDGILRYLF